MQGFFTPLCHVAPTQGAFSLLVRMSILHVALRLRSRTRMHFLLNPAPSSRPSTEHGQVLILFAAGLVAILGLVGMAIDVGQVVVTRTDLQKSADAGAFAAAQDLPSADDAQGTGTGYVLLNSAEDTGAEVTVSSTHGTNDTVTVRTERAVDYHFLRFVGLSGTTVSAQATVRVGSFVGGTGLLPFGFIASNENNSTLLQNPCYLGQENGVPTFKQNVSCQIKYGAGSSAGGDFGALALGGGGASTYESNIRDGTTGGYRVGQRVAAETGNMSGPTNHGAADRFAKSPPASCSTNDSDQIVVANSDGTTSIKPGCETHPRIGIIPVVDQIDNPNESTILGFSFVILEGVSGNGANQKVSVRFVEFVTEIPGGIYEGWGDGAQAIKLVE